jgi:hypothetical protein
MVDLGALRALNAVGGKRLANLPGEMDELVKVGSCNRVGVMLDQKKPIAAPGDVAGHRAVPGNFDVDGSGPAVAGYVLEGHRAVFVQGGSHDPHRCFKAVKARLDPAQVCERGYDTDRSMSAHAQASAVVEENDARNAICTGGLAKQCAYHRFGSPGFGDESPAEGFVIPLKQKATLLQVTAAEVRGTFDDGSRRLAAGVRIDNPDLFQETLLLRFLCKL